MTPKEHVPSYNVWKKIKKTYILETFNLVSSLFDNAMNEPKGTMESSNVPELQFMNRQ